MVKLKELIFAVPLVLFLWLLPQYSLFAEAESTKPISQSIESTLEGVRKILLEEKGKLSDKDLAEKLRVAVLPMFDFGEMSRRSLGKNWKGAESNQQEQFIQLFSKLLSRTYIGKIRENLENSEVNYVSEKVQGKRAIVKTKVNLKDEDVSIDYRLRLRNGAWKIYDVVVENVGLVSNYRNEFSSIVRKEGMNGLLDRLEKKLRKPLVQDV